VHPWLSKVAGARDNAMPFESLKLQTLAKLQQYVAHPEAHLNDILATYEYTRVDIPQLRERLSKLAPPAGSGNISHCRFQTMYSIVLAFASILNTILRSFGLEDMTLAEESVGLIDELITVTNDAAQYKPLGSGAIPLFLTTAWAATRDKSKQARIKETISEYSSDPAFPVWMEIAGWLDNKLNSHRYTQSTSFQMDIEMPRLEDGVCFTM
jgi:hypothetical protein